MDRYPSVCRGRTATARVIEKSEKQKSKGKHGESYRHIASDGMFKLSGKNKETNTDAIRGARNVITANVPRAYSSMVLRPASTRSKYTSHCFAGLRLPLRRGEEGHQTVLGRT